MKPKYHNFLIHTRASEMGEGGERGKGLVSGVSKFESVRAACA